jgi:hypothetical protein
MKKSTDTKELCPSSMSSITSSKDSFCILSQYIGSVKDCYFQKTTKIQQIFNENKNESTPIIWGWKLENTTEGSTFPSLPVLFQQALL